MRCKCWTVVDGDWLVLVIDCLMFTLQQGSPFMAGHVLCDILRCALLGGSNLRHITMQEAVHAGGLSCIRPFNLRADTVGVHEESGITSQYC